MIDTSEIIKKELSKQPVLYVTRDKERALGMTEGDGYFVISNVGDEVLDTYKLLETDRVSDFVKKNPSTGILVFQNNSRIERLCKEKGWKLLNPSAELGKLVEEKISQTEWLGDLSSLLVPFEIKKLSDINPSNYPFVLQWNHAHTGEGTFLIKKETELQTLAEKFPERPARISKFIDGPIFTLNSIVCGDKVLTGNVSYQITGLKPFTNNDFSTIGNDFALPHKILSEKEIGEIKDMAVAIGDRLGDPQATSAGASWKGLFGIDVVQDKNTGKIYLLEINARQPASTTFESQLQKQADPSGLTTFGAHLASLLGLPVANDQLPFLNSGAQIVLRHSDFLKNVRISLVVEKLKSAGFNVLEYNNTEPNKEILRIQTNSHFMDDHGKLSSEGMAVRDIILSNE